MLQSQPGGLASFAPYSGNCAGMKYALLPLMRGYLYWDRFEHQKIGRSFAEGTKELKRYRDTTGLVGLDPLLAAVEDNKKFLDNLQQDSAGFKRMSAFHVADLQANAMRRAEEGKYDDAIARLYRALELAAQIALLHRDPPIETDKVLLQSVPSSLTSEFKARYLDRDTATLKLPLVAAYRLLEALDDPVGHHFRSRFDEYKVILAARNSSILAHGVAVHGREAFEKFLDLMQGTTAEPLPRFPQLDLLVALKPSQQLAAR